jgi:hypothetical protein
VLDELRRRAHRGIVCETTGTIATTLQVSTDTVLRGLKDLTAAGLIEDTGLRRGKARAFRLIESPQAAAESPQPLPRTDSSQPVGVTAEETPKGLPAAVHLIAAAADAPGRDCTHSSCEGLSECRYSGSTPEELAEAARQARKILERLSFGDSMPAFPDADEGPCDDCRQMAQDRQHYGSVDVCRGCLTRRYTVGMKMEVAVAQAEGRA